MKNRKNNENKGMKRALAGILAAIMLFSSPASISVTQVRAAEMESEEVLTEEVGTAEDAEVLAQEAAAEAAAPIVEEEAATSNAAVMEDKQSFQETSSAEVMEAATESTETAAPVAESAASEVEVASEEETLTLAEETKEVEETETVEEEAEETEEVEEETDEDTAYAEGELTARSANFEITMRFDKDAKIPEGAKLQVRELRENSKEYNEVKAMFDEQAGVTEEDTSDNRAIVDISILDENNEEIEPAAAVDINVVVRNAERNPEDFAGNVTVTHLEEKPNSDAVAVEMDVEVTTETVEVANEDEPLVVTTEIDFTVDSFSYFDLRWNNVQGKEQEIQAFYGYYVNGSFHEFSSETRPFAIAKQVNPSTTGRAPAQLAWGENFHDLISSGSLSKHDFDKAQYELTMSSNLPAGYDPNSVEVWLVRAADVRNMGSGDAYQDPRSVGQQIKSVVESRIDWSTDELHWYTWPYDRPGSEISSVKLEDGDEIYLVYKGGEPKYNIAQESTPGKTVYGGDTYKSPVTPTYDSELGVPKHNKTMTPNNDGDGTYTVELSVEAESQRSKDYNKTDVIFVIDRTGSMREPSGVAGKTKEQVVNEALNNVVNNLMDYNYVDPTLTGAALEAEENKRDAVRISVIDFSNFAQVTEAGTFDRATALKKAQVINNGGQTNWEEALLKVSEIKTRSEAKPYVVFITDGQPNIRATAGPWKDREYFNMGYSNALKNAAIDLGETWDGGRYFTNGTLYKAMYDAGYVTDPTKNWQEIEDVTDYFDMFREGWHKGYVTGAHPWYCGVNFDNLTGYEIDEDATRAANANNTGEPIIVYKTDENGNKIPIDGGSSGFVYGWWRDYADDNPDYDASYAAARDFAVLIGQSGMNFMTLGAFMGDTQLGRLSELAKAGGANGTYAAGTPEQFEAVFRQLIQSVTGQLGYSDVKITDTITERTAVSLTNGSSTNLTQYRYYENMPMARPSNYVGNLSDGNWEKWMKDDVEHQQWCYMHLSEEDTHKYLLPGLTWEEMPAVAPADVRAAGEAAAAANPRTQAQERDLVAAASYKDWYIWDDPNVKKPYYQDGKVIWDIKYTNGNAYTLTDGMTYKVGFTVWPDQDAYDLISDIENGYLNVQDDGKNITAVSPKADAPQWIKDKYKGNDFLDTFTRIYKENGKYYLYSNEANSSTPDKVFLEWKVTETTINENGTPTTTTTEKLTSAYERPDGMILDDAKVNVKKIWEAATAERLKALIANDAEAELAINRRENLTNTGTSGKYYEPIKLSVTAEDVNSNKVEVVAEEDIYVSVGLAVSDPVYITKNESARVSISINGAAARDFYTLDKGWTYFLTENSQTPANAFIFSTDDNVYPVLLDGKLYAVSAPGKDGVFKATAMDKTFNLTGKNRHPELRIKKTDMEGNYLEGAEFYVNDRIKFLNKAQGLPMTYEGEGVYSIDFTNSVFTNMSGGDPKPFEYNRVYYLVETKPADGGYELFGGLVAPTNASRGYKGLPFYISEDGKVHIATAAEEEAARTDPSNDAPRADEFRVDENTISKMVEYDEDNNMLIIKNKKVFKVELTKVDEKGETLANAKFELYKVGNPDELIDEEKTTGADGKLLWENLEAGDYYLLETGVPDGYIDFKFGNTDGIVKLPFKVASNGTVTVDGKTADVRTDAYGHVFLGGKQLYVQPEEGETQLTAGATLTTTATEYPLTLVTSDGKETPVSGPSTGTDYYLYAGQSGGEAWYVTDNGTASVLSTTKTRYSFNQVYNNPNKVNTLWNNSMNTRLYLEDDVVKVAAYNSFTPFNGGILTEYNAADDTNTIKLKAQNIKDETTARIEAEKLLKTNGKITALDSGAFEFTIKGVDENLNPKTNPMPDKTTVGNLASTGAGKGLVSFGDIVFDKAGTYYYLIEEKVDQAREDDGSMKYEKRKVLAKVVVAKNDKGRLAASVQYKYIEDGKTYDYTNDKLTFENNGTVFYTIKLNKRDENNTKNLSDAQFKLYAESEYPNGTGKPAVSETTGEFVWSNLPYGIYFIVEDQAPEGYEKFNAPIKVELKEVNDETVLVYLDGPTNVPEIVTSKTNKLGDSEFGWGASLTFNAPNKPLEVDIDLVKVDKFNAQNEPGDATFALNKLTAESGKQYTLGEAKDPITVSSAGKNVKLDGAGWYQLKETKAPVGYVIASTPWFINASWKDNEDGTWTPEKKVYTSVEITEAQKNALAADEEWIAVKEGSATKYYKLTEVGTKTINSKKHFELENVEIYELPSSGGMGTYLHTMLGFMFMALAAAVAYMKVFKKKLAFVTNNR